MAERSNAHDSKSCDAGMYPWVQIPLSAPAKGEVFGSRFFALLCPKIGKKREFCRLFALIFVHDVRADNAHLSEKRMPIK